MTSASTAPPTAPAQPRRPSAHTIGGSPSTSANAVPASTSSLRNPISLRLYKVLSSTNFSDPSSLEALQTVSDLYAEAGQAAANDGTTIASGEGSAARARKGLRRDGEERLAEGSRRFLAAFGDVDKKLDTLQLHMEEMHTRCDDVQSKLEGANSGTKYLLSRAEGLRNQRTSTQLRSTLIDLFLSRFTLAQAELESLTSRDVQVGPSLFAAMDRVTAIRRDCRALLGGDEGGTTAGLDIMRATSHQLEVGYQKIFRWCTFEFRQFAREAQLEVSPVLREAVRRLRDRKPLLTEALQMLSNLRSSSLLALFLDALTRGGPGGLPRPIELHAHDPQRYVSDMLAWVHQATAGEREFLESLFGSPRGAGRMIGAARGGETDAGRDEKGKAPGDEEEELVRDMLDRDLEGCCRPLRIRVQQTIKTQDDVITSYRIVNLLQFYLLTMRQTIGADALLTRTLQDIHDVSYKAFFDTLDAQGRSLLRFLHPPDADLSPPLALRDATQTLREMLSAHEATLLDDPQQAAEGEEFARVLDAAVDPPLEMCRRMADLRQGAGGEWERAVFLANCVGYLEHVLESYSFTTARVALLQDQMDRHVRQLLDEHYERCLAQSGLGPVSKLLQEKDADTPLSRIPGAEPSALSAALHTFDAHLQTLDVLSSPRLALLSSPALARDIHRGALARLARAYETLWDAVMDREANRYEFPTSLLLRGKDEVRTLLGVDEDEEGGQE